MIDLLPLHLDQAPIFHRWLRDPEVIAYSLSVFQDPMTLEQVAVWLTHILADARSLKLGIYLADTQELWGGSVKTDSAKIG